MAGPSPPDRLEVRPSRFVAEDVFKLERAADVQISPDGRKIVYVRQAADIMTDGDRSSLWLLDRRSGVQIPLSRGRASGARWSPDSRRLAFVEDVAGGRPGLAILDVASRRVVRLPGPSGSPGQLSWSPDGKRIAFAMFVPGASPSFGAPPARPPGAAWAAPLKITTAARWQADGAGDLPPGRTHLFVISASGGPARQLTSGDYDADGVPSWTADGAHLLFSSARRADRDSSYFGREIYQVAVANGVLRQLTETGGINRDPAASPDGRAIAFIGIELTTRAYEVSRLYVIGADGGRPKPLAGSLDRDVAAPRWAADGRSLFVSLADGGVSNIARIALNGQVTRITDQLGGDESYSVSDAGVVAFARGAFAHPAEVGVSEHRGTRSLTANNARLLGARLLGQSRRLSVPARGDGVPIDVRLTLPADHQPGRRYPLILSIHGGPFGYDLPHWSSEYQLYAAAGYVVANANYRGSTSYGSAFSHRVARAFPAVADDDLLSVVDALVANGIADGERLFVIGGSAGAELAGWMTGKTDRFKAAVLQKPVVNQISNALGNDQYLGAGVYAFGTEPWQDVMPFWRRSPLSLVGSMKTPTMLIVGEEDRRTPPSEAFQLYHALQVRGVPTALVRVPGASHSSLAARPSQYLAQISATLAWFGRFGGPIEEPDEAVAEAE